jgi:UDP-N-acetylglucosamine acyltransferase
MSDIHPTAIIAEGAEISEGCVIGPYSLIGEGVRLGPNVRVDGHVNIEGDTEIGEGCRLFPFCSIGSIPQDLKYAGEKTRLVIGRDNIIREHVTMNPGTAGGGGLTHVGDGGLFMMGAHVAHDCHVGDNVILANNATLAGHCQLGDHVILGGLSAVHQFVRIGERAFVGGMAGVEADIIPFGMAMGNRASLAGLNLVGMRRSGMKREEIHGVRRAYRRLFSGDGTLKERIAELEEDKEFASNESVGKILAFIRADSDRSFCLPAA